MKGHISRCPSNPKTTNRPLVYNSNTKKLSIKSKGYARSPWLIPPVGTLQQPHCGHDPAAVRSSVLGASAHLHESERTPWTAAAPTTATMDDNNGSEEEWG